MRSHLETQVSRDGYSSGAISTKDESTTLSSAKGGCQLGRNIQTGRHRFRVLEILIVFTACTFARGETVSLGEQNDPLQLTPAWSSYYLMFGAGVEHYDSPTLLRDEGGSIDFGEDNHRASRYLETSFGAERGIPLGRGAEWITGIDFEFRRLPELPELEVDRLDAQTGFRWPLWVAGVESGDLRVRALAGHADYGQGAMSRNLLGVSADVRHKVTAFDSHSFRLDWRRYGFDAANDRLDADRWAMTLGYIRRNPEGWKPQLALRAVLASERNRWHDAALSFTRAALRAKFSATPRPGWESWASIETRQTRYRAPESGHDFSRRDRTMVMQTGIGYALDKATTLACEIEYSRADSNNILYAGNSQVIGCAYHLDY